MPGIGKNHIWREWNEAAGDVRSSNGDGASQSATWFGLFQSQFKSHHEVYPSFGALPQSVHDWSALFRRQAVGLENLADLARFLVRYFLDLAFLAQAFLFVVLGIAASGEVAAQAHGDRPGCDFRQSANYDQTGLWDRP